jgi:hypothetical protein
MADPQVDLGKVRYDIMASMKNYMSNHTLLKGNTKIILGDPWLLDKYPCIGIMWVKDQNASIYKGGKADCYLSVEMWVETNSPDPEKPYILLKELEGKASKVLTEYAYKNLASTDVDANVFVDILGVESDAMMFSPVYGLKLQVLAKWSKLGR